MEDITFLSDYEKVHKLVAYVKHKFNVFSVSNTLFPKNKISDYKLKSFFEKISDRTTKILNTPNGINTPLTIQSSTLDDLSQIVIDYLQDFEVIVFYDLTYEPNSDRYSIRFYKFEDNLRLKSIKREKKIDDLLNNICHS